MLAFKESNEKDCLHEIITKLQGTKGLYMITKSSDWIVKYIKVGMNIYKHFLFDGLYTW